MKRRSCINCETTWSSLADHELDGPHMCPLCGDELAPLAPAANDRAAQAKA